MKHILVSACLLGVNCRYNGIPKEHPGVLSLLKRDDITLIPVCPEQLGGLCTPRHPSEVQKDGRVVMNDGTDVTKQYCQGAEEALKLARLYGCRTAILKERSPSCGCGMIYDGSFSKTLTQGNGKTSDLLLKEGIQVLGESEIEYLN